MFTFLAKFWGLVLASGWGRNFCKNSPDSHAQPTTAAHKLVLEKVRPPC